MIRITGDMDPVLREASPQSHFISPFVENMNLIRENQIISQNESTPKLSVVVNKRAGWNAPFPSLCEKGKFKIT